MNKIDLFIKHKLLITKPKTYLLTKMNDIIHIENFIDSDEATHIFNNLNRRRIKIANSRISLLMFLQ